MKTDALGFDLRRFDSLPAVITLAVLIAAVPGWLAAFSSGTQPPATSPGLTLTFTNLPPEGWALEITTNLVDWFSIIRSGDVPPLELTIPLTNANHAAFYRLRSLP